jgi:predicted metal-dependent phosphoesterase TrpH
MHTGSGNPGRYRADNTDLELWKFDMHVHSSYSGDSLNSPADIVASFRQTGILPLVCDHNTTEGSAVVYQEIRKMAPEVPEIFAEEIMTADGEIIGLFLTDPVPPYLPAEETLEVIHDQGGLALVPHPFCSFRTSSALRRDTLTVIAGDVDIIEGFNGRTLRDEDNEMAREFATRHGKPLSVGSDSHLPRNLGRYWLELEPFGTPEELMKSLTSGTIRFPVLLREPAQNDNSLSV